MAASKVSPEIKAAALADLAGGEQPAVVAERYGLDRNTVKMWKQRYVTASVTDPVTTSVPARPIVRPSVEVRQRQIGELILDNLRAKLEASAAIARAASNEKWLAGQTAADLATLGQWLDSSAFAIGDRLAGRDVDGAPAAPAQPALAAAPRRPEDDPTAWGPDESDRNG